MAIQSVMARVEYGEGNTPCRVILGAQVDSDTLYLVFPVYEDGLGDICVAPPMTAFQGTASQQVPLSKVPLKLQQALRAQATHALLHAVSPEEPDILPCSQGESRTKPGASEGL